MVSTTPSNYKKEKNLLELANDAAVLYAAGDLGRDPGSLEDHLTGF